MPRVCPRIFARFLTRPSAVSFTPRSPRRRVRARRRKVPEEREFRSRAKSARAGRTKFHRDTELGRRRQSTGSALLERLISKERRQLRIDGRNRIAYGRKLIARRRIASRRDRRSRSTKMPYKGRTIRRRRCQTTIDRRRDNSGVDLYHGKVIDRSSPARSRVRERKYARVCDFLFARRSLRRLISLRNKQVKAQTAYLCGIDTHLRLKSSELC